MRRKSLRRVLAPFAACLLFAAPYAFPGGSGDSQGTTAERPAGNAEWIVTSEAVASPGDALIVRIESALVLSDTSVTLISPDGTAVASAGGFRALPDKAASEPDTPVGYIVILGLPDTLSPGTYGLRASANIPERGGQEICSDHPLILEARAFLSEAIDLDEKNTKIKTDFGPKRIAQIKALNEILFTRNHDADRFPGPFVLPVAQTRRTSQFGDRRTYRYIDGETERNVHLGIDFGIPAGTPVIAAGSGRIALAEFRISTGWTVVIEHLPGVYSLYYHLDSLACAKGDTVQTGELIARSGSTGLSTGPHLHWEFRVNGIAVSPDWFVGRVLY